MITNAYLFGGVRYFFLFGMSQLTDFVSLYKVYEKNNKLDVPI